ncbi:MAG: DNA polymerase III subunit delta [Phycisphaerales bacterium]|nr:DNA polymerase III subunit delta [Phycisphaerales bacterium]
MASTAPEARHRIVILHGKDAFIRTERTRQLVESLREAHGDLDEIRFDGQTASLAAVLDEARTCGLLCPHKLVVLDNAEAFIAHEDRRRALERYAESPTQQITLLLRAPTWRPGNFDKLVAQVGLVLKCEPPAAAEATRWAMARCSKRQGCSLDLDAAELLIEKVGADLGRIDMELGKLAVLALVSIGVASSTSTIAAARITRAMVQEMVGPSREEQAWVIQESLLCGNAAAAIAKAGELIKIARAPEVMVSWAVIDLWRKIHIAAELLAAGQSESTVAKSLKLWGDSTEPLLRMARRIGSERASKAFHKAVLMDRAMKSGLAPDPLRAIECLIVDSMCEAQTI